MERISFTACGGVRLDKQIAENTELSRSAAARLIEQGFVTVNGKVLGKKDSPPEGVLVEIILPELKAAIFFPRTYRWKSFMRTRICWL